MYYACFGQNIDGSVLPGQVGPFAEWFRPWGVAGLRPGRHLTVNGRPSERPQGSPPRHSFLTSASTPWSRRALAGSPFEIWDGKIVIGLCRKVNQNRNLLIRLACSRVFWGLQPIRSRAWAPERKVPMCWTLQQRWLWYVPKLNASLTDMVFAFNRYKM